MIIMWFHLSNTKGFWFIFFWLLDFVFKYLTTKYPSLVQSKWRSNQVNPKATEAVSSTLLCQRPDAACAHMVNNLTHCLENTPAQSLRNTSHASSYTVSKSACQWIAWMTSWLIIFKKTYFVWFWVHLVHSCAQKYPPCTFITILHETVQCLIRFQVHGSCC